MEPALITREALERARSLRDLTDPAQGPHAMQMLLDRIRAALERAWGCPSITHRADPVVAVEDNYDRLHYPPDGAARDARYSRYTAPGMLLRTHTSAMIPSLLRSLGSAPPDDVLLVCPGIVYRRDAIDRLHTGEPHQADLWRISRRARLTMADLGDMIGRLVAAAVPGRAYRLVPATHPYTTDGLQVDVRDGDAWVEIAECGLALPALLEESGLDSRAYTGLAMGMGLDRLLMLVKGIDDIRLLRAADPRIAGQMLDLAPYRRVSSQPPIRRDLSVMVGASLTPEEIGDRVRGALGDGAGRIESLDVRGETPYEQLPPTAIERMGALPGQKNVLVRLVIRDVARTLTSDEANAVRDRVYAALHEGTVAEWAGRRGVVGS